MKYNLILMITRILIFGMLIVSTVFDYYTKEMKDRQIEAQRNTIDFLLRSMK